MPIGPAQFEATPFGEGLPDAVELKLATIADADALAAPRGSVSILLSRHLLEQLRDERPQAWSTEAERMALIHGKRAATLLSLVTAQHNARGHAVVPQLGSEGEYLASALLKSGQAAVLEHASMRQLGVIVLRFHSFRAGPTAGAAFEHYSVTKAAAPFLSLQSAVA